jgi:DNA polymerase-3 subunit delta
MLKLYPEQLRAQLNEGLRAAYLLLGNDPLLLQESHDAVRQAAFAQDFTEHHAFTIDASTDWDAIYAICQALSLFASRQILSLQLPENGPNAALNERLAMLVGLLHDDLILIVRGNKLTKAQENAAWYTALANRSVSVSCQTPEQANLPVGLPHVRSRTTCNWTTPPISCFAIATKESIGRRAGAGKAGAALPGR